MPQILKNTQEKMLKTHKENRKEKVYHVGQVVYEKKNGERNKLKTRKNAIAEYLDYQIPVTQQSEIKMRHLPAVDRFKRYGR